MGYEKVFQKLLLVALAGITLLAGCTAEAKKNAIKSLELPIGVVKTAKAEPYSAALTYLPPFDIEPAGVTLPRKNSDFHLKMAVLATDDHSYGVKTNGRVPGLHVSYKMIKMETGQNVEGELLPLTDEAGAYYGANLKLFGEGTYKCIFALAREPKAGDGEVSPMEEMTWIFKFVPHTKWK